jgi:hypothetical protein
MATTKVSALAAKTNTVGAEELLINDNGTSKKVTITNVLPDDSVLEKHLNLISTSSVPSLEAKGTSGSTSGYIKLNCSENSHGIKLLGPPHSATADYTLTFPNDDGNASQVLTTNGSGVLTWTTPSSTDSTKMPLAGGAFSGAVTTNSTIDGRDVAADGVTADAALPKAGGTVTGNILHNDNVVSSWGTGGDLSIYHDGSNSYIRDSGDGDIHIRSDAGFRVQNANGSENYIYAAADGLVRLYHNNAGKLDTTATGIDVTGNIVVSGTVDGVDIQTLNTTASAALPKSGGTMTGDLTMTSAADNKPHLLLRNDHNADTDDAPIIELYQNDTTTGGIADDTDVGVIRFSGDEKDGGSKEIYSEIRGVAHDAGQGTGNRGNLSFFVQTAGSLFETLTLDESTVKVTGNAVGTLTTDNDGSFAMSASNNFKCTPAGNFALTFTAIVAQSGNILFINSGGHTISAHANTKVDANLLATISTAGTYLLSYFSDGTNVYMTNSAAYA